MRRTTLFALCLGVAAIALARPMPLIPELDNTGGGGTGDPIEALDDAKQAPGAVDRLVAKGDAAIDPLVEVAITHSDVAAQGWAVTALSRIPGPKADVALKQVQDRAGSDIVRVWAIAGQISRAEKLDDVIAQAQHAAYYPALNRPIKLAAERLISDADVVSLLKLVATQPQMAQTVGSLIVAADPGELARVMQESKDDQVRRQAAAYLGSISNQGKKAEISALVVERLRFKPGKTAPWQGGALYIPAIGWDQTESRKLVRELIKWQLSFHASGDMNQARQVQNNLRSVGLTQAAGFSNAWLDVSNIDVLLQGWQEVMGTKEIESILKEQELLNDGRFNKVLK
jgi:hypothetical protein